MAILDAETYFVAGGRDVAMTIQQIVFGKLFEVPMLMAGGPNKKRIGRWIANEQVAIANIPCFSGKTNQTPIADNLATFDYFTIAVGKSSTENSRRSGRPPDDEVRQRIRGLVPVETEDAGSPAEAVHGDMIGSSRNRCEGKAALTIRGA